MHLGPCFAQERQQRPPHLRPALSPPPLPALLGDASWLDGLPLPDLFWDQDPLSPAAAGSELHADTDLFLPLLFPPTCPTSAGGLAEAAPSSLEAPQPGLDGSSSAALGGSGQLPPLPDLLPPLPSGGGGAASPTAAGAAAGGLAHQVKEEAVMLPDEPVQQAQQQQGGKRAGKQGGRKRGRPRLYDTAGGCCGDAAWMLHSTESCASPFFSPLCSAVAAALVRCRSLLHAPLRVLPHCTHPALSLSTPAALAAPAAADSNPDATAPASKRGRGPKPKYVYGSREEAAGARRERNRKAALDSYYKWVNGRVCGWWVVGALVGGGWVHLWMMGLGGVDRVTSLHCRRSDLCRNSFGPTPPRQQ